MRVTQMMRPGMRKQILTLVTFAVAAFAAAACGELTGPESPSTPTNVVATLVNPTTVTVTWTPSPLNDGVISYSVYRNGAKVGESDGTATTYTDTGLTPQQTYVYTVAANCVGGVVSERSEETAASTVITRDATPPTVVQTIPIPDATQVSPIADVNVIFSEPMDASTINATTFTLRITGGAAIPGVVTYNPATRRATLTPSSSLPNPVQFTATVSTGVKDVGGNALAAPYTFRFTTRDDTPPTVTATSPTEGEPGVSPSVVISITFSEAMDPATITSANMPLRVQPSGAVVPAIVAYNTATRVATVTPTSPLDQNTSYSLFLSTGLKDLGGNSLASMLLNFRTGDTTAPSVTSTNPVDLATGVAVGTAVTATFSEAMDPASVTTTTFSLSVASSGAAVAGTVGYNPATTTATFTPSSALAAGTMYRATVTTGARDSFGNPLGAAKIWTFTTADATPPTVTGVVPANNAPGVALNTTVHVTFSEPMTASTINGTNVFLRPSSSSTPVPAVVTYETATNTAVITPNAPLAGNTQYTVTVTTGVRDAAGNALVSQFTSTFTTLTTDTTAPTVTGVVPANSANGVALNTTVRVTFNEAMAASTINGTNVFLRPTSSSTPVAAVVTYETGTNTAVITPNAPLAGTTQYTVTVTTGVTDASGNALASQFTSTFTTLTPDVTPPTVTAVVPANNAAAVATNTTVRLTFSEAMDQSTINTTNITLRTTSPSVVVAGTMSYDPATRVATFTPTAPLANSTNYTVTVTTAVKDSAGNALASQFTSTFTTAAPDVTAPLATQTTPIGATDAPINTVVAVTFNEPMDSTTITTATFIVTRTSGTPALVAGTVAYNSTTRVATFTPSGGVFVAAATYSVNVTAGAKDIAGNGAIPLTFNFQTAP